MISSFGLLLHEANCCQQNESTLDVFALPTTIRADPDEACWPTGPQCRGKNRENLQKFANFRSTKTNTRHGVTSQISLAKTLEKKGIQTNLTSNNTRYTPERAASTDTLSAEPPKEQHLLKNQKEHHLSKEQHQGPGCLQTSVSMKQNVLKSFPGVAWPKRKKKSYLYEINLNLNSWVVLSNRTSYIISPLGLLLHEANCCQRHESTLDVFALPTTIRVDPDEACRPTGHQCRGKNRENSQKFALFRLTKTNTRHGVTD